MAVREIKTSLTLDGEKQFKAELDAAYRSMKTLGSELKLNTASFQDNASGMAALTKKSGILRSEIAQQKEIVSTLEKAVKEATDTYGDTGSKTDAWRVKLNNAKAALANMQSELKETEKKTTGLGAVFTTIKQKTDSWKKSLASVSDGLNTAAGAVTKATAGVAAIGAAAVTAGKQIYDLARNTGTLADSLLTTSKQTGVSTKTLQEWEYAADFIDTDVDTMTGAMAKMVNQLDSVASGSGDTAKAFKKLHVSIKENGELKDSETLFYEIIDALGDVENETQRDSLAMQIFGKSAQDLNPLIEAGSDALKRYGEEAENAGVVMSDDTVTAFGAFDDQMNTIDSTITGLKQNFISALLPAIEKIVPVVQQVATSFSNWLQSDAAQSLLAGLGDKIAAVATQLSENLGPTIEKAIDAFSTTVNVVGWLIDNFQTIVTVGGVLAGVLVALKVAQLAVNIAMAANPAGAIALAISALIAGIVLLIANWDSVKQAAADAWEGMKAAWGSCVDFFAGIWNSITTGFASLWAAIQNIFSGVGSFFSGIWSQIVTSFNNFWTQIVNIGNSIVQGIWQGIQAAGSWLYDKLFGWVDDVVGWAKDILGIRSPSTVMRDKIGKPMAQGVAEGMRRNIGLVKSAMRSLTPDTQTVSVMLDVNRRFNSVAESTLTRTQTVKSAEPTTETDRAGTAGAGKEGVTVNQYIYANETSYAEQQRQAASRMREVIWELS